MDMSAHVGGNMMSNRVSLAHIIELGVQRTYHELTILAELLPRKTDLERKIEIVNFVSRTRMLFIRILALVKWAGGASKVEQCMEIVAFLDKQALLFINTADNLVNMARTTLVQARLPSFQLPCAVEVLTLGTYSKMPTCIRNRIVPPDPITPEEKRSTLSKLNHIIEQKLSVSALPIRMRNLIIEHGRVTFHVANEFNLTLTMLGDSQNLPWKVLKLEILVQDLDTGDGKDLVHLAHVNKISHILQQRIMDHPTPLVECHNLLHSFCLSLQVEVLHDQMERLLRDRLTGYIRILEHVPGVRLVISYWKARYTLRIEVDTSDPSKPLKLTHQPEFESLQSQIQNKNLLSEKEQQRDVSIERLISETVHKRAACKLAQVSEEIREKNLGSCFMKGKPVMLYVSYLQPCRECEQLVIAIDPLNGSFLVHVPLLLSQNQHSTSSQNVCELIQETLNNSSNHNKLSFHFEQLRICMMKIRCKKTLEYLSVTTSENLPLCTKTASQNQSKLIDDKIQRLFFQFNKYNQHYLMTEFFTSQNVLDNNFVSPSDSVNEVQMKHYLLSIETMTGDGIDREMFPDMPVESLQRDLIVVDNLMQLCIPKIVQSGYNSTGIDTRYLQGSPISKSYQNQHDPTYLHINGTAICRLGQKLSSTNGRKRALFTTLSGIKRQKRVQAPAYHIAELPQLVGFCEEKLAFTLVSHELKRREIPHKVIRSTSSASAHHIVFAPSQFPPSLFGVSDALQLDTLSATMSVQEKFSKLWVTTFMFHNCPVVSQSYKEHGPRRILFMNYDAPLTNQKQVAKFLDDALQDWSCVAHLYDIVKQFSNDLKRMTTLYDQMSIRSFTYRKITLSYGAQRQYSVTILWRFTDKKFHLLFGVVGSAGGTTSFKVNPHSIMSLYYKHDFNLNPSIALLVKNLNISLTPLEAIHNLTLNVPLPPAYQHQQQLQSINLLSNQKRYYQTLASTWPVLSFCIIPVSTSHIRLVYRNLYCLDITIHSDGSLCIRDGAYSRFDNSRVIEDLQPIQQFLTFVYNLSDSEPAIRLLLQQCRRLQHN